MRRNIKNKKTKKKVLHGGLRRDQRKADRGISDDRHREIERKVVHPVNQTDGKIGILNTSKTSAN